MNIDHKRNFNKYRKYFLRMPLVIGLLFFIIFTVREVAKDPQKFKPRLGKYGAPKEKTEYDSSEVVVLDFEHYTYHRWRKCDRVEGYMPEKNRAYADGEGMYRCQVCFQAEIADTLKN